MQKALHQRSKFIQKLRKRQKRGRTLETTLENASQVEEAEMQKRTAPETASVQDEHQPTVVSSADKRKKSLETALPEDESSFKGTAISSDDGTKILKNLDVAIAKSRGFRFLCCPKLR